MCKLYSNLMKYNGLKRETKVLTTVVQDQVLNTSKCIINKRSTDKCQMCHIQTETVEHIISEFQTLEVDRKF